MAEILDELAVRLRQRLLERFGVEVPVVVAKAGEPRPAGPHLLLEYPTGPSSGDIYSGQQFTYRGSLVGFVPPGAAAPLKVSLAFRVHDLSGQTDDWEVAVEGAPEDQRSAWRDFFQPRTWPVLLGNYARCFISFDGGPKLDF